MAEQSAGVPVELFIYDLTHGMALMFSSTLLGRQIEGVWHTSIVVFGNEYFFGGGGITSCPPGSTQLGQPQRIERLGITFVPKQVFSDYLHGLAISTYAPITYHLLEHNCNNFTDEVSQFLCGVGIPKYILDLPNEVLSTAMRNNITTLLDNLVPEGASPQIMSDASGMRSGGVRGESPEFLQLNNQIEEARARSMVLGQQRTTLAEKLARREKKQDKKRKKQQKNHDDGGAMSEESATACDGPRLNGAGAEAEAESAESGEGVGERNRRVQVVDDTCQEEEDERRKHKEPPIVFKDLQPIDVFDKLVESLGEMPLSPEEQQSLDELHQYLVQGEGSWALGDNFLTFVGRMIGSADVPEIVRERLLLCLAACALRDDVVLLLHQDRRDHTLMNYAHNVDRLPLVEQRALALFMCNLFESVSASEWLLYISEWSSGTQQLSNIKSTTKVAVHSLLSEDDKLREIGTAIVHNLAVKEVKTVVFDEVAVELAMAILQLFSTRPSEEHLFRGMKALARFTQLASQEVPQLIQLVGPSPNDFRGTSPRIDEHIDIVMKRVR